ncbi:MAG: branched-chain amino acid ABC transporter permease [Proteobacteria bacterium]|nr:branched-chain amino acid ABC transporter permease [Pseudomonadota bacterium]
MIYREAGQFKTTYTADQAVFPIVQDRWFIAAVAFLALGVPFVANEYWLQVVLIPFLLFSLAAIGLNLLTGYTGQLSLGTGGFMAVGGYMTYKITTAFPDLNILVVFAAAGLISAGAGLVFGLPSLRIKGFYLAVATLASQFFLGWLFNRVGWFYNYSSSGTITAPPREILGIMVTGPEATAEVRYYVALAIVTVMAVAAKNLVRGRIGRSWMAIRDMDVAAEIIGIRPFRTKLLAFSISSFYCGVAGAMLVFLWLGSAETEAFDIVVSFDVLFMIIIGGLGSILGSFLGAAFIVLVPVLLTNAPQLFGLTMAIDLQKHIEVVLFGSLIIFFLIVEPNGLARLWQITKEKLRLWPFPY